MERIVSEEGRRRRVLVDGGFYCESVGGKRENLEVGSAGGDN